MIAFDTDASVSVFSLVTASVTGISSSCIVAEHCVDGIDWYGLQDVQGVGGRRAGKSARAVEH